MSKGRLRLAPWLRVDSASPDNQGPPPLLPTAEGRLCLARRPRATSASLDGRGQTLPRPTSTPCSFIRMSTGYDMTFESNTAPRTMPYAAVGKVPPGYDGMGALDHSGIAESEQYCRRRLQPSDTEPDVDIRQPLRSRKGLAPSTMTDVLSPRCGSKGAAPAPQPLGSTRSEHSLQPLDALSDRKALPKALLLTPIPCPFIGARRNQKAYGERQGKAHKSKSLYQRPYPMRSSTL